MTHFQEEEAMHLVTSCPDSFRSCATVMAHQCSVLEAGGMHYVWDYCCFSACRHRSLIHQCCERLARDTAE